MTPDRLAEIKARADAATAGPWKGTTDEGVYLVNGKPIFETGCGCCTSGTLSEADAAFIASSRTDIPDLLAEVMRLSSSLTFFVGRDGKPGPNGEPGGKGGALIFQAPENDCEVVRFSYSGGIQVNPKFAPDEAARKFWNVVAQCSRSTYARSQQP